MVAAAEDATVSVKVVICVVFVPVPIIVSGYIPTGVVAAVCTLKVAAPDEFSVDGLNAEVAPGGNPETERATPLLYPPFTLTIDVAVPDWPVDKAAGWAETVKSGLLETMTGINNWCVIAGEALDALSFNQKAPAGV